MAISSRRVDTARGLQKGEKEREERERGREKICKDMKMWRTENNMPRYEDKKMYNKPPLLQEPFAQTLSGKIRKEEFKLLNFL